MAEITFGSEYEFLAANGAEEIRLAFLTSTTFVVAYRDAADSDKGTCKIGTISGTVVSFGSEMEFDTSAVSHVDVTRLSDTAFALVWRGTQAKTRVGTVSGSTISYGTVSSPWTSTPSGVLTHRIASVTPTKFVVIYSTGSGGNRAKIGTITGTTISLGSSVLWDTSGFCDCAALTRIDDTHVLIAYADGGSSYVGTAIRGTVSGTTITFGAKNNFTTGAIAYMMDLAMLSSTSFIVAYSDHSLPNDGQVKVGTLSGDSITYGSETEFSTLGIENFLAVTKFSSTEFAVCYKDAADANHGVAKVGAVSGTTVTFDTETKFLAADGVAYVASTEVDDRGFVVGYTDGTDANHGTVQIGQIPSAETLIQASGDLFIQGRDSRYCLYHENVVFYHPCNDHIEATAEHAWSGATTTFAPGLIVSGIQLVDGETFLSCHHDSHCGYPPIEGATSFAMAFWSSGLFAVGPDADVFIGNSSSPTEIADENGIYFHGNTGKPMIHLDGDGGQAIGSLVPTPTDDDWHFVTIYAEMSGGNWHIYGSLDGGELDYLTNDNSSTSPMSGQPYLTIHVDDPVSSSPEPIVDEVICWVGLDAPFTQNEILNMYEMGYTHSVPLNAYREHYEAGSSAPLFIMGPQSITGSGDLFIDSLTNHATSGDLFVHGVSDQSQQCNLFIYGHKTLNLYTTGHGLSSDSCNMFTFSYTDLVASGDLFIRGITTAQSSPSESARPLDWLLKTADHYPQIIGTFDTPANSVTIQIWDITNGQNALISVSNSGCYSIGDTGRWGWSTSGLPTTQGHASHYFYMMTSDATETFDGQFLMEAPEGAKWIHPGSQDDYLRRV